MINLLGKKFGRLTPLAYLGSSVWRCKCDCGNVCDVTSYNVSHGRTKSCGCVAKENAHNLNLKPPGESAATHVYLNIKNSAKIRGYEFNVTRDDILNLIFLPCHYCGKLPANEQKNRYGNSGIVYSGIDRIDNRIGYTKDNIVPCCWTCNERKKAMTKKDFLDWIKTVYEHNFA